MRFEIEDEAVHLALAFADGVELLEPTALRARVRAGAAALAHVYATDAPLA